jgi:hypothetical protein
MDLTHCHRILLQNCSLLARRSRNVGRRQLLHQHQVRVEASLVEIQQHLAAITEKITEYEWAMCNDQPITCTPPTEAQAR